MADSFGQDDVVKFFLYLQIFQVINLEFKVREVLGSLFYHAGADVHPYSSGGLYGSEKLPGTASYLQDRRSFRYEISEVFFQFSVVITPLAAPFVAHGGYGVKMSDTFLLVQWSIPF